MAEHQPVNTTKTKWVWKRKCACGDCRFYSWEERPDCPAMKADPALVGEKLWYIASGMLGMKDYEESPDYQETVSYVEKAKPVSKEKVDESKEE